MLEILHQAIYVVMVIAAILLLAITIERYIFANTNFRRARKVIDEISESSFTLANSNPTDAVLEMLFEIDKGRKTVSKQEQIQDIADASYIHARDKLFNKLWILDTIVTAAPLLGLLGTIFGIVDTFYAISSSGMSDPSGVSAGIGTALYSTAFGIALALAGLLFFNYLSQLNERICEYLKMIILRTTGHIA